MFTPDTYMKSEEVRPYRFKHGLVGMMDCGGSNLMMINKQIPDVVRMIVSSRHPNHEESSAKERAQQFGVPLVYVDIAGYEESKGVYPGDYFKALYYSGMSRKSAHGQREIVNIRRDACNYLADEIEKTMDQEGLRNIPFFGAGFMSLLSAEFVERYPIWNVHPADLRYLGSDGRPLFAGETWKPSSKAIRAGFNILYTTVHQMTAEMDAGQIHMRGYPLRIPDRFRVVADLNDKVLMKNVAEAAQDTLKLLGDHTAAGATFMDLFAGRFGRSEHGLAYQLKGEWHSVPQGIGIEHHVLNWNCTRSPCELTEQQLHEVYESFARRLRKITGGK